MSLDFPLDLTSYPLLQ